MRLRPFGRTGIAVSQLTIGTAGIDAAGQADAGEFGAALALAFERGINAIELEAGGATEGIVADILRRGGMAQRAHIFARTSSLVPFDLPSPHVPAYRAYPGHHIRAQTEATLAKLGVERLACQQIHAWCPEWLGEGDWLETLVRLREEGKIAAIGVSLFDHDADAGLQAIARGAIDCIQLMYNIFDQGPAEALLPLCARRGLAVIARSPLYFGAISPRLHHPEPFAKGDWRIEYFLDAHLAETRERVAQLEEEVMSGRDVADLALRFSLSHPAVSTVAIGMRNRRHVEANLESVEQGPLDAEVLTQLRRHRWLC